MSTPAQTIHSAQHMIIVDITEPNRGLGYVDGGVDFLLRREGWTWLIFGGSQDEFRGSGSTLDVALRRFAAAVGAAGTAEITYEYQGDRRRIVTLDRS